MGYIIVVAIVCYFLYKVMALSSLDSSKFGDLIEKVGDTLKSSNKDTLEAFKKYEEIRERNMLMSSPEEKEAFEQFKQYLLVEKDKEIDIAVEHAKKELPKYLAEKK